MIRSGVCLAAAAFLGWPASVAMAASATPAPCSLPANPPLILLYASLGGDTNYEMLKGCPGEVVVGEKGGGPPGNPMRTVAAHKAGGRTAYVMSNFGLEIRDMLKQPGGTQKTADFINKKLAQGFDYVVIDEITAHPDWKDGSTVNRRFREMLLKVPSRKVIAYVSLDLTMRAGGGEKLRARKYLMRALKRRARVIALEVYLHTREAMNGAAPRAFRIASDRLAKSVKGLSGGAGINRRAIIVLGVSMHSIYPQYRYLDQPRNDLKSVQRQARAIQDGTKRLRSQKGIGFYFVNRSDILPPASAPYGYGDLVKRMASDARRWR